MFTISADVIEQFSIAPCYRDYLIRKKEELARAKESTPQGKPRSQKNKAKEKNAGSREMVDYSLLSEGKVDPPNIMGLCPPPRASWCENAEKTKYYEGFHRYLKAPIFNLEQELIALDNKMEASKDEMTGEEWKEWKCWKILHQKVYTEQREFLQYAAKAAEAHPEFTGILNNQYDYQYVRDLLEVDMVCRLAKLPKFYEAMPSEHSIHLTPSCLDPNAEIQFLREQQVKILGYLPSLNIPKTLGPHFTIKTQRVAEHFPVSPEALDGTTEERFDWKLPVLSQDPVAREIVESHNVDIVISADSLVCLLNNQGPHFRFPWFLPLHVTKTSTGRRYIIVDKSLKVERHLSAQDKKYMLYKRGLLVKWLNFSKSPDGGIWDSRPIVTQPDAGEKMNKLENEDEESMETELPTINEETKAKRSLDHAADKNAASIQGDDFSDDGSYLMIDEPAPVFTEDDCPQSPEADPNGFDVDLDLSADADGLALGPKTIPLERVSESEADSSKQSHSIFNTSISQDSIPPKNADLKVRRRCWTYALWRFAGKRILIRYSLHGAVTVQSADEKEKPSKSSQVPAYLQMKVENQPYFGSELLTFRELWKAWVADLLRGRAEIIRARVNYGCGRILMIERESCAQMLKMYGGFDPKAGVVVLYNIFKRFDYFSEGLYLLNHDIESPVCRIHRAVDGNVSENDAVRRNLLHLPTFVRQSPEVPIKTPWIPIDLRIYNSILDEKKLPPCIFRGSPARAVDAWKNKKKKSRYNRGRGRGRGGNVSNQEGGQ